MVKTRNGVRSPCALVTVAVLGLLGAQAIAQEPDEPEGTEAQVETIAAFPFADSSPEGPYGPLADAMGDMIASYLSRAEGLAFVERVALNKVLKEHELTLAGLVEDKTKAKVGKLLGARYILTGGVTVLDEKLKVSAHLFEVETTRVARSESAEGKVEDLLHVVQSVAEKLAADLDLELPELKDEDIDKHPEANLHFMRGLGYYYANMRDHAIAEFMKTLVLDSKHASARYWNGVCYFDGREHEHAKIEFDRFLKEFPKHELVPRVKEMVEVCDSEIQEQSAAEQGE